MNNPTPEGMRLEQLALEQPEKIFALLKAMGQSSSFSEQAEQMSNEVLVSKVEELVLNHLPCLEQGYAVLDEALSRLVPTRKNSAFPPAT